MLELADKKFKAAIVNTSTDLKEKIRKNEQIEYATKRNGKCNKEPLEILELQSTIHEMNKTLDGF